MCFESCIDIRKSLIMNEDYEIYYNYNKTKCIDKIPDVYYLNDTNNKTIDKCNNKCKTCNNESKINDLCISCNIDNNYFPIINTNSNFNIYINCSNYVPSGYFFDNYSLSFIPCYSTCKKCIKFGDNYNHQCLECNSDYYLSNSNCYQNCAYYYYFDDLHIHHCTADNNCPANKKKLIIEKGECIDDCSKDILYKYEYNNICYNENKSDFINNIVQLNFSDLINKYKINNVINASQADEIINDIRKMLMNGSLNSLISDIVEKEKEDLLIKDDNIIYQISSSSSFIFNLLRSPIL